MCDFFKILMVLAVLVSARAAFAQVPCTAGTFVSSNPPCTLHLDKVDSNTVPVSVATHFLRAVDFNEHKNALLDLRAAVSGFAGLTYADAAARTSATLTTADIGKIARQTDDGTLWICSDNDPLTWLQLGVGDKTYDLLFSIPSISSASQEVAAVELNRAVNIPSGCTSSRAVAASNPTVARTFTIKKRTEAQVETTIGTIEISSATGIGTYTCASPVSLADTDSIVIVAPTPLDSGLGKVSITLRANLP